MFGFNIQCFMSPHYLLPTVLYKSGFDNYIMTTTSCLGILHMSDLSYSHIQWAYYSVKYENPLGSVEVNPFADSFPGSNTTTPLQGSNTIASIPVNLESDVEHSVQDINSPVKNATP
ncbi:hypothetical protein ACJX0J_039596 [Zea mays]